MKYIKYLFIIIVFIFTSNVYAHSFDNTIKVYDYAQVLSESEQTRIKTKVLEYISNYKIDMCIVTVRYYNQEKLEDYSDDFYTINGFDQQGIILAIDVKNNKSSIKVHGTNLYTDDEISSIKKSIDEKDNYYDKFDSFIYLLNEYANGNRIVQESNSIINLEKILMVLIPSILIPTVVVIIILFMKKKDNIDDLYYFVEKESIVINKSEDKFITTNTKQIKRKNYKA